MTRLATTAAELVPVDQLEPHPANPRIGDIDTITESIRTHGFYGAVIAQRSSRRILAGNHRWQAAKAEGLEAVPVMWLDVDDDEALRVLLVDNRANDTAGYDDSQLAALLEDLAGSARRFEGTGFDDGALQGLLASLAGKADLAAEWDGMPAYESNDMGSIFHCTVHFASQEDADAFFERIGKAKRSSLWWPDSDGHRSESIRDKYVEA